jgi:hypothetical protein
MGMILTRTDATFSWPRDQSIRECQDENAGTAEGFPDQCQWREELQVREKENAPCLSHLGTVSYWQENENLPLEGGSVISECKKACICVTVESRVRTYGCML